MPSQMHPSLSLFESKWAQTLRVTSRVNDQALQPRYTPNAVPSQYIYYYHP